MRKGGLIIISTDSYEVWFLTGSQELYGKEVLRKVEENSKKLVNALNEKITAPAKIMWKPVLKDAIQIKATIDEANSNNRCIGLIAWMHTFSPAKMWIAGLKSVHKPFLHLHTQFDQKIPWDTIDMDYMNTNQSAHGGREFGFISTRLEMKRKVIAGHWTDKTVISKLEDWLRAALGWNEAHRLKVARLGDNMRDVAVTEGNKVDAQIDFGYEIHGFAVGDYIEGYFKKVKRSEAEELVKEYLKEYPVVKSTVSEEEFQSSVREAARIEISLRRFLEDGGFKAFTTTFEDLHGMKQLPGIAVQRLMRDGYGFGGEGDWKSAALVRIMKVMAEGIDKGTSFIEDYVYHFEPGNVKELGAHMLEVCESIADGTPSLEVHPLSIGGKEPPTRLVFNAKAGPAVQACIVEFGDRFRMIVNELDVVKQEVAMPKLPVARVLWIPKPDLSTAATAWILAGGAHHSSMSYTVTTEQLEDLCEMFGIEIVVIDENTDIREFKKELRYNEIYYKLKKL
ncbi:MULTISPECIES: L-arabinose isomerase [Mesotoga]|uniref:L-arabinose isomerase n=1 Tax=Mesotoga TaxID=1184396 RepID=UPI0002C99DC0|nr:MULTISPECIES: L-arabinose isomerase [Mesotoga]CCU84222.1 L-arabinose isomerase [Mesotoga infera]HNQ70337.1 L-arabinose isomerase [Mesotoga prima]HNS75247.1 L-arabinose isomerase [Mesotoga prima]HOP38100.1 L-arabinose isomerase [Mesotoga prima]HPE53609.1 L-arabinose isomerase [Mesotoga prima]